MKESLKRKLESIAERHEEVAALLSEASVICDQNKFRKLSQEFAELEPVVKCFNDYRKVLGDIDAARLLMDDADPEMRAMGEEEASSSAISLI